MPYLGPALDLSRFYAELIPAAIAAGFQPETYGEAAGWPLYVLRRWSKQANAPTIYLSAGVHGDEPAGPLALLRILLQKNFSTDYHWLIFPALNPAGLAAKTRENAGGLDVNRDYRSPRSAEAAQHLAYLAHEVEAGAGRYALCLLLHEDWEVDGCYLYELNRSPHPLIGPALLAAVRPICGVDDKPVIEGMEAKHGLITRPVASFEDFPHWPEAIYLAMHHTERSLTFEAPSAQTLNRRIAATITAVRSAVRAWEKAAQPPR